MLAPALAVSESIVDRFVREARAVNQIRHRNLDGAVEGAGPEVGLGLLEMFARRSEFVGDDDVDLLIVGVDGEIFTYFRAMSRGVDPRR